MSEQDNNPFNPDLAAITGAAPDVSTSLSVAADLDPMKEARIKELSAKTNLDIDMLRALSPEELKPIELNPEAHIMTPVMNQYFAQPSRAAISYDDAPNLAEAESQAEAFARIKFEPPVALQAGETGIEEGQLGVYAGDLGMKAMEIARNATGPLELGDLKYQIEGVKDLLRQKNESKQKLNLGPRIVGEAGYLAGMSSALMAKGLPDVLAGAVGGFTGMVIGTGYNPMALPADALAGFVGAAIAASSGAASFKQMHNVEAGNAFLDLIDEKDEFGKPIDPKVAVVAAQAVGVVNAALEMYGMRALSKVPGIGKYIGAMTGEDVVAGAKMMLQNPEVRKRMGEIALAFGKSTLAEVSTEMLQEIPGQLASYIAKAKMNREQGGTFRLPKDFIGFDDPNAMIDLKPLVEVGKSTALGVVGLGGLPVMHAMYGTYGEAEQARKRGEALNNLRTALQNSNTAERSPEALKEFVGALVANSPDGLQTLYVDGKDALELFQKDRTVFDKLGIIDSDIQDAATHGDAIKISTEKLLGDLVSPELNPQYNALSKILKVAPGALSEAEADTLESPESVQRAIELFQTATKGGDKVQVALEKIGKQLDGMGFDPAKTDAYKTLLGSFAYRQILDGRSAEETTKPLENLIIKLEARKQQAPSGMPQTGPDIWDVGSIKQEMKSDKTSINSTKLPATFGKIKVSEGQVVADIGGGRFDNAVEWASKQGATLHVIDPFNRSIEHNKKAIEAVRGGKADVVTVNNVLNVIKEEENRRRVLEQAFDALRPGGTGYILIYEGSGTGEGAVTQQGQSWQNNRKTKAYLDEVKAVFGNAVLKNGMIQVTKSSDQVATLSQTGKAVADQILAFILNEGQDPDKVTPGSESTGPTTFNQVHNLPEWKEKRIAWMKAQKEFDGKTRRFTDKEIKENVAAAEAQLRILSALTPVQIEMFPNTVGDSERTAPGGLSSGFWGPLRNNSEVMYKLTFDLSSMCVKRLETAATLAYIEERLPALTGGKKIVLTGAERVALMALFKIAGKAAPCLYCYVEGPRSKEGEAIDHGLRVVFNNDAPGPDWSDTTLAAAKLAKDFIKKNKIKPADVDIGSLLDPFRRDTEETKKIHAKAEPLYRFLRDMRQTAKAKKQDLYSVYNAEILDIPREVLDEINQYAGLRFFSNSDFQPEHVVDMMQAFMDMEIKGAKAHSYTKVPMFAEIFGATGMKIQLSIFADIDKKTGKLKEDTWQGMSWDEAQRLRKKYPNVGTILVATSPEAIQWGLDTDWVDYIIPYHTASGFTSEFYESLDWLNFSGGQKEKWKAFPKFEPTKFPPLTGTKEEKAKERERRNKIIDAEKKAESARRAKIKKDRGGFPPQIKMHMLGAVDGRGKLTRDQQHLAMRERYFELCEKRGVRPVFDEVLLANGKSVTTHPSYIKLKKDYARSDTPFVPVKAQFNMDEVQKALTMVTTGEITKYEANEEIAKELIKMIKAGKTEIADVQDLLRKAKINRTFNQTRNLGFYSSLENYIMTSDFKSISAKDLINRINGAYQKGVIKKEEVDDIGLIDWLTGLESKRVTPEEIGEFIRNNGPTLEFSEKIPWAEWLLVRGHEKRQFSSQRERQAGFTQWVEELVSEDPAGFQERYQIRTRESLSDYGYTEAGPKFILWDVSEETSLWSGDSHTEGVDELEGFMRRSYNRSIDLARGGDYNDGLSIDTLSELSAEGDNHRNFVVRDPSKSHLFEKDKIDWGEFGRGALAHARTTDIPSDLSSYGVVLFIDEIQSNIHQAARETGYENGKKMLSAEEQKQAVDKVANIEKRMSEVPFGGPEYAQLQLERRDQYRFLLENVPGWGKSLDELRGVPNLPFKKSWHMMVFKRLLRKAIEEGYDSIAWTSGAQQNDRYQELIHNIEAIEVIRREDENGVTLNYLTAKYMEGGIVPGLEKGLTNEQLPNIVGVDLAKKIVAIPAGQAQSFSGLDITIGGEGMVKFYDKDLVTDIGKYVKKWGGKIEDFEVEENGKTFTSHRLIITEDMKNDILNRGQTLYQPGGEVMASTTIESTGYVIRLFKGAYDESSLLHELGHVFLLETQAWVATGKASKETMKDWAILQKWFGVKPGDTLQREHHEKFAVGFEQYLREGRAPSIELESAFDQFKSWLRKVYKTVTAIFSRAGFEPELSPQVRSVFDRMIATDTEIEAAATRDGLLIPGSDLDRLGVKPVDKAYIKYLIDKAKELGKAKFEKKRAQEDAKKFKSWVDSAKAQVAEERVYKAWNRAKKEGLDAAEVERIVGKEHARALAKRIIGSVRKEDGMTPDAVAAETGYDSGQEMLEDLLTAPTKSERVKQIVEERRNTPDATAKTPEEEMLDGAELEEYVAAIGRQLLKKVNPTRMARSQDEAVGNRTIQRTAQQRLSSMPIREAIRVDLFLSAFRNASVKCRDAMGQDQWQVALEHNLQARLQLEMVKQSRKIREDLESSISHVKDAIKSKSIDLDHLYNLINTANRFGLTSKRIPFDNTRLTLAGILTPDEDVGMDPPPAFSPELTNEQNSQDYRDMPTGLAQELFDLLKYLEVSGRRLLSGKLLTQSVTRQEMELELMGEMPAVKSKTFEKNSLFRRISDTAREYLASCRTLHFIFRAADGWAKTGKHITMLWNKLQEGYNNKINRLDELQKKLKPALDYLHERGRSWDPAKHPMPRVPKLLVEDGRAWTWEYVLGIALNRGNTYNNSAVMKAYDLTLADINQITASLTVDDWVHIQTIWDTVNSLWPDLKQTYEDVAVIAPKKVEADPFAVTTADGTYRLIRGGYFPLTFDSALSLRAGEWSEKDSILNQVQGAFVNPRVPAGYMQARTGTGGLPVQLDYRTTLLKHLDFATSYIGMARILKDIDVITRSKAYSYAFIDRFGVQMYKQIRPALSYVARGSIKGFDAMEGMIRNLAAMGSATAMFGRASTILKQFFDSGTLASEIGIRAFLDGMAINMKNPISAIRFIEDASPSMRVRWRSHYAGLEEAAMANWINKSFGGKAVEMATEVFAMPFHIFDIINTSAAWMGKYQQHLAETMDHEGAVHAADNAVESAAPSRRPMDLSSFQRDASAFKILFAPFNSWRIKFQNRLVSTVEGVQAGKISLFEAGRFAFLEVFYPTVGWYVMQSIIRSWPGAPEPEEKDVGGILSDMVRTLTGAFPIVGDVPQAVLEFIGEVRSRGAFEPPAIKAMQDITKAAKDAFKPTGEFEEDEQGIFAIKRRLWGLAAAASIVLRVPATRLYLDLTEGLRQYEETGRPGLIFLPDPELRRR